MDENELEQALRDGLTRRAGHADTAAPVADRARTAVRRRRAGRRSALLAAAAVVAVAGVAVALDREPSGPGADVTGRVPDRGDTVAVWRTERWHDLQVEVPDTWGWGAAPPACGVGSVVSAGGLRNAGETEKAYVGRPISNTDVCGGAPSSPPAPYLWLGSDREVGVVEMGDGYVEETVKVAGSRLTVATDDDALRRRILASAASGGACASELDVDDASFPTVAPGDVWREADALRVCAYQSPESAPRRADLVYATTLDLGGLHAYLAALRAGEPPRDQCLALDYTEGEWVVLEVATEEGEVLRRDVVHTFCPGIDVGADSLRGLETVRLTPELVEPWAGEGVAAVVHGPIRGDVARFSDYFIGPQG
jgi:hypothetical protein